jgi:hypothetical protein
MTMIAWNLMRGVEWSAIPVLVAMLGVKDVGRLVMGLDVIRSAMESKNDG